MESKHLHFRVSKELAIRIDEAARAAGCTRSTYIRQAIILRLRGKAIIEQEGQNFLVELRKRYGRN